MVIEQTFFSGGQYDNNYKIVVAEKAGYGFSEVNYFIGNKAENRPRKLLLRLFFIAFKRRIRLAG
ncbi:hypothetical protein [Evansella clarkii]|uniref:hypothetical protein n=1 Tax=Evansella clarkii TaxID=79879 RepID=UPI00147653D6|nr:hypothetical protein [Evansella clarkii]